MFKKRIVPYIEFASEIDYHCLPTSVKKHTPAWYKDMSLYAHGNNIMDSNNPMNSIKRCMPFLDSLLLGYVLELWCDVLVTKTADNKSHFSYRVEPMVIEERPISGSITLPVPAGHSAQRLAWKIPYYIRTPKGYSTLITHPFNRFDLPFTTLTGVVDTERVMYSGNLPFFIVSDFEGIIPKGTPIAQVFPYKRENWNSKETSSLVQEGDKYERMAMSVINGFYKKTVWKKKEFN